MVQNFAARIIKGARKFDHITPCLQELAWLPVKDQIRYGDLMLTFKCLNNMAPSYLSSSFSVRSSVHECNARNKNDLETIFRTSVGQRTFEFRATELWNNLDSNIKENSSFKTFEKQFKQTMLAVTPS